MSGFCDCCKAETETESFNLNWHGEPKKLCYFCANTHVVNWVNCPGTRTREQIELAQEFNLVANLILDKLNVTSRSPNPVCEVHQ